LIAAIATLDAGDGKMILISYRRRILGSEMIRFGVSTRSRRSFRSSSPPSAAAASEPIAKEIGERSSSTWMRPVFFSSSLALHVPDGPSAGLHAGSAGPTR
jgi:hypothetical protein